MPDFELHVLFVERLCVYTHTHVYMQIYIYTYIYMQRQGFPYDFDLGRFNLNDVNRVAIDSCVT